ncbi:oligosaccharide flippase family protein [Nitratireductor soli]|uniref:oligosaccharide flippase family protein n=1 Tax=Nitratireductor soli TaxID=1670619 RepID=UPI00065E317E|nr:oligosaccharide flippase family protein [Nitratireductor soli]
MGIEQRPGVEAQPRTILGMPFPGLLGGGLWALAAKLVSQVAQLAAFIMAARLLTPTEFGFFAFTSAMAIFLVVVAEGGWAEYIMKSEENSRRWRQVAAVSLGSGVLLTAAGLAAAAVFYAYLGKHWEGGLLALFSLWILPSSLTAVYDGVLVNRGMLHRQAAIRIVAELGALSVTAAGLLAGWNVVALIVGRLTMQGLILCGSVAVVGWIAPSLPSRSFIGELLQFSRYILSNRMIIFLRSYSGTLAVGSFLGLSEAGYYRAAERIVAAFSELIGEPARMLAWIVFRRAHAEKPGAQGGAKGTAGVGNRFFPVLFAVAAPVYLGLALVSGDLVHLALGAGWAPAALVVGILAAKQLLLVPSYVTEPLLAIRGAVNRLPPVSLLNGAVSVSLVLITAPFGFVWVAVGQCIAAAIALATSVWLQARYGGIDWRRVLRNSGFVAIASAVMLVAVHYFKGVAGQAGLSALQSFLVQVLVGGLIYIPVLALSWKWVGVTMPHPAAEKP